MGLFDEKRGIKVSMSRLADKVVEKRSILSTSRAVAMADLHKKTKKVIRERGMSMGTGTFKHGTLHLSAKDLKAINSSSSSSSSFKKRNSKVSNKKR